MSVKNLEIRGADELTLPFSAQNGFTEVSGYYVAQRALEDVPPVGDDIVAGEEFWTRRNMHQGEYGPNWHTLGAVGMGVFVSDETATLQIPTLERVNDFVAQHNPDGMRFVPTAGMLKADEFLERIMAGEFAVGHEQSPFWKDGVYKVTDKVLQTKEGVLGLKPHTRQAVIAYAGRTATFDVGSSFITTNILEHDYTDHLGIVAMTPEGVQKLGTAARQLACLTERTFITKDEGVQILDRLLHTYSYFATTPVRPHDAFAVHVRQAIVADVTKYANALNDVAETYRTPVLLDLDAEVQNIARLQALPARGLVV